jgi:hypothetical protein
MLNLTNIFFLPYLSISQPPEIAPRALPIYEAKFIKLLFSLASFEFHPNFAAKIFAV